MGIYAKVLPHLSQNFAVSRLSVLHFAQRIALILSYVLNSSSTALASFRSAVSKPSVNQL
jgi:hypothetical protein